METGALVISSVLSGLPFGTLSGTVPLRGSKPRHEDADLGGRGTSSKEKGKPTASLNSWMGLCKLFEWALQGFKGIRGLHPASNTSPLISPPILGGPGCVGALRVHDGLRAQRRLKQGSNLFPPAKALLRLVLLQSRSQRLVKLEGHVGVKLLKRKLSTSRLTRLL